MPRATLAFLTAFALALVLPSLATAQAAPPSSGTKNAINGINSYPGPEFVKYAREREPSRTVESTSLSATGKARCLAPSTVPWYFVTSLFAATTSLLHRKVQFCVPPTFSPMAGWLRVHGQLRRTLEGQQEVYYVLGGEGEVTAGADTAKLHKGIAVLMPAGLEFVMKSVGDEPLTMYVINEPTPSGFHPKDKMVVKDEGAARQRTPAAADPYIVGGASGHWAHIVERDIFSGRRAGD